MAAIWYIVVSVTIVADISARKEWQLNIHE